MYIFYPLSKHNFLGSKFKTNILSSLLSYLPVCLSSYPFHPPHCHFTHLPNNSVADPPLRLKPLCCRPSPLALHKLRWAPVSILHACISPRLRWLQTLDPSPQWHLPSNLINDQSNQLCGKQRKKRVCWQQYGRTCWDFERFHSSNCSTSKASSKTLFF